VRHNQYENPFDAVTRFLCRRLAALASGLWEELVPLAGRCRQWVFGHWSVGGGIFEGSVLGSRPGLR